MKKFIMQMRPWFDEQERKAIDKYMLSDGFITEFQLTKRLENEIAKYTKSKHCIMVNNGTISLTVAAIALGIGYGDEVIVPNYTMVASPNSIKMIGAKPVFADVEKGTLCLDFNELQKKITKKTKAIILVSPNGRFPKKNIEEYIKFCKKNKIFIIEDAAQSLGSFYADGNHIGTKGIVGSFSFSSQKIITTGQGGALITNSDNLAKKIRKLKDFGRSSGGNDIHNSIGFNFKFTELQSCIGLVQMKKLNKRVNLKKQIWKKYYKNLKDLEELKLINHNLTYTAPWFIDATCKKRDKLKKYLAENNIGSRKMYPPLNKQKAYKVKGSFPVSENIARNGLWLPSSSQITDKEINYICKKINQFYKSSNL
jgi:perosamine synthetase